MRRVAVLNTHPIQYFAPVYAALKEQKDLRVRVIYASKRGIIDALDCGFGRSVRWNVPLLEGYEYEFLPRADRNASREPDEHDVSGLDGCLTGFDPDVVVVHGYSDRLSRAGIAWASTHRRLLLMRGDTWSGPGEVGGFAKRLLKRVYLRYTITPKVTLFLAVGTRNLEYWRSIGAAPDQTVIARYGVDRRRFRPATDARERLTARLQLGVGPVERVVGFYGKFIPKKGLLPILKVAADAGTLPLRFLIVGDGPQKAAVEKYVRGILPQPVLTGFANQAAMPDLYRVADLVIMPSVTGETWGFAAHEALACGIPVIVSDNVGCAPDLIKDGRNGWILPPPDGDLWMRFLIGWSTGQKLLDQHSGPGVPGLEEAAQDLLSAMRRPE